MGKNAKGRTLPQGESYEIYCSVSQDRLIGKLMRLGAERIVELEKTHQYKQAEQLRASIIEIDELSVQAEPFPIVNDSSAISYSHNLICRKNSSIEKLIHCLNSSIGKAQLLDNLSHLESSAIGKAQPFPIAKSSAIPNLIHSLDQLFPGCELFYVRKHYKSESAENADRYARVLASYIGPYEVDKAGHDIYLSELKQRGHMVYIKNDDIYQVPDIYQFKANLP